MEPERSIATAIKNLSNQFHRYMTARKMEFDAEFKGFDKVTDIQGRIINYLYENMERDDEVVHQKDIERYFNIRRSTATNILKRIEKNGFIRRSTSASDARMKTLSLTEKAKRLCPKAKEGILRVERQAAQGLTDAELALFFRIIEIMGRNIA